MTEFRIRASIMRIATVSAAVFLLFILIGLFPSHNIYAEIQSGDVASVGDDGYETLQEAVDQASSGATVTLLKDVDESINCIDKDLILDLGGNVIECPNSGSDNYCINISGGKVTVKNGELRGGTKGAKVGVGYPDYLNSATEISRGGTLSINNGEVNVEDVSFVKAKGSSVVSVDSQLTMIGCEIAGNSGDYYGTVFIQGGSAGITDTLISENTDQFATIVVTGGAVAEIDGCEIKNNTARNVGGVLIGTGNTAGDVKLTNTSVTGNKGINNTCSGGVYVNKGKFVMENSAVSDNLHENSQHETASDDISVNDWEQGSFIQKADTMMGDYAHYVWDNKGDAISTEIRQGDGNPLPLTLTAVKDDPDDPVAEYYGQTYSSLSGAVKKAIEDNAADGQDKSIKLLKDTKDSISIGQAVSISGTIDVDLGGFTVKGKDKVSPIVDVKGGGTGNLVFHDGRFENARTDTVRMSWGAALRFITTDAPRVVLKNVEIADCQKISIYADTSGSLELEDCLLTQSEAGIRDGIQVDKAKEVKLTGCTIEKCETALVVQGRSAAKTKLYVDACTFKDNGTSKNTGADYVIDIGGTVFQMSLDGVNYNIQDYCEAVFTDTEITGNNVSNSNIPTHVIRITKNSSLKMTGCSITDNSASYKTDHRSATIFDDGILTLDDCEIRNNRAGAAGAIYQTEYAKMINLSNTVIQGNTAAGKASGTGENVSGGLVIEEFGYGINVKSPYDKFAIYGNTVENMPSSSYVARDLFVGGYSDINHNSQSRSFIKASDMKDEGMDFSGKVWKDDARTGYDETPWYQRNYARYYAVVDRGGETNVARIEGKGEYRSISEAIQYAEDGDVIELISEELNVISGSVNVDKNVTIDLCGRIITPDSYSYALPLLKVASGITLTIKNTLSDEKHDQGNVRADGIQVVDGGTLIIDDEMANLTVENNGALIINDGPRKSDIILGKTKTVQLGDGCDLEGKILTVKLDNETAAKYNNASQSDTDPVPDLVVVENVPADMTQHINITNITSGEILRKIKNGNLVLTLARAVYIDGVNGMDNRSGLEPELAVRTFGEAKRILEERGFDTIIVVDTVTVNNEQTWDLAGKEIIRYRENGNNLIRVGFRGDLTLNDIVIDGQRYNVDIPTKSLIKVARGGKLTIEEGTVLKDNDISGNGTEDTLRGGAIDSEGNIKMSGGSIENCVAALGGGIYQSYGSFDFTGGKIDGNETVFKYFKEMSSLSGQSDVCNGGGVLLGFGAVMNMSGNAEVTNNVAEGSGGGISLGTRFARYTTTGGTTTFNLTGGKIDGNDGAAGGGILVQNYAVANVEGSESSHIYITNNKARKSPGYVAGGGIYVNGMHISANNYGSGILNIKNVEMTGNSSAVDGAAIASCVTSETYVRDLEGALMYDNTSYTRGGSGAIENNQVALTARSLMGDTGLDALGVLRGDSTISRYMPGGGEYNWKTADGSDLTDAEIEKIQETLLMVSDLDSEDPSVKAAKDLTFVHLNNNSAVNGCGGAIGNNGLVYVGSYRHYMKVGVKKLWDDAVETKPGSIKVLLKQDGSEYKAAVIRPDSEGNWPEYIFEKLPVYKLDGTGAETEEKHEYTIVEDGSYKPEGSEKTIGELYVPSIEKKETTTEPDRETEDPAYADKQISTEHYEISNSYKPIYVDPPVRKVITGEPDEPMSFTFVLTPDKESYNMPDEKVGGSKTMTVDGEGYYEFGEFAIDAPGTYDYHVIEGIPGGTDENNKLGNWTFDSAKWIIRYEVADNNGELSVVRTFYKDGEQVDSVDAPTFVNSFKKTVKETDTTTTTRPKDPTEPSDPDKPANPTDPNNPTNPTDPNSPAGPSDPSDPVKHSKPGKGVSTGDEAKVIWWLAMFIIATVVITAMTIRKRVCRQKQN